VDIGPPWAFRDCAPEANGSTIHPMTTIRSSDLNRFRSGGREQSSSPLAEPFSPIASGKTETPHSRYVLPQNIDAAIQRLDDRELDRLVSAALEERARRKKPPTPEQSQGKRLAETDAVPLPQGKLNAVKAAFKAGVTPARIAREFGISQADVRRALIRDAKRN
jgi:hypothetical protein